MSYKKRNIFIYLKEQERRGEGGKRERDRILPSASSLFTWPQPPGLKQTKVRSQEPYPGLPHGAKDPDTPAGS